VIVPLACGLSVWFVWSCSYSSKMRKLVMSFLGLSAFFEVIFLVNSAKSLFSIFRSRNRGFSFFLRIPLYLIVIFVLKNTVKKPNLDSSEYREFVTVALNTWIDMVIQASELIILKKDSSLNQNTLSNLNTDKLFGYIYKLYYSDSNNLSVVASEIVSYLKTQGFEGFEKKPVFISDDITQLKEYSTTVTIDDEMHQFNYVIVDPEFIPLMDIELVQGENFSQDIKSQMGESYILNEAAWDILKHSKTKDAGYKINGGSLLGVIKNFHFESLHNTINPMMLYWAPDNYFNKALLKLTAGNRAQTINYINEIYKELAPGSLCKKKFIDEEFNALYTTDRIMVKLLGIFSLLAILIATLGIISLSYPLN
jgi:hypothetical protein